MCSLTSFALMRDLGDDLISNDRETFVPDFQHSECGFHNLGPRLM
jgi:hypothetical protein